MSQQTTSYRFGKEEKLCSNIAIETLFSKGKSFVAYPLRIVYYTAEKDVDDAVNAQLLVSVSKKKFKRAVKRNRVKRLVREAYRLNKQTFLDGLNDDNKKISIACIYLKNELPTYDEIEKAMIKALSILSEKRIEREQ